MKKEVASTENQDVLLNQNKIKVLEIIRNQREITRAEIIRQSGLSAPTITRIVDRLSQLNLIQNDELGSSIGGRPPQIIRFNGRNNFVIGIDLGATFIRSALSNLDGEFIFEIHLPTNLKRGFDGVMEQVGEVILKLTDRAQKNQLNLWGIGIAVCGMVNKKTGLVEYSPIFGWKNVDIQQALLKYTNLKIVLGNVTHLIALGEMLYGVGKTYRNFICINAGYGIGSGIIVDGKLFTGAHGFAGEIGHIVVDKYSNRQGLEGVKGTLEALASGYGIADLARELLVDYPGSLLAAFDGDDLNAKRVFEAAMEGDDLANIIIGAVTEYLSIGIDILIKLFNTECIVLSGGLMQNGTILLDKIKHTLPQYTMNELTQEVPVVMANFGENAALMGSFSLILEKILQLERNEIS
jgi:glucokinase-like ROK family protein